MLSSKVNLLKLVPQNYYRYRSVRKYVLRPMINDPKKKTDEDDENGNEFQKFKMKQLKFQMDDGKPIHLKAGKRDKFFYYATLWLCGFGLMNYFAFIYYSALSEKDKKKFDEFWELK
ncbi:hypothetical protein PVAND_009625 [Polypedilum vanderplanki]|uniref:Uncharacterized protein n=1 Tax=Polypedilum vanderplanki TaxID=319348 RepID=A0A9J6CE94_POLVA|nr:hypothetical protein PVAND_009625 [Polypedilum vanderplanki]